jgi:predicted nuclease of predicted toxin-antitoxin system
MPLPPALAHWLATQGHDAVHASTMGLDRSADTEILTRAKQDARTVVTPIWTIHGCWLLPERTHQA